MGDPMKGWMDRWYSVTSFLICATVVLLGTVLYPLVFLVFLTIALIHPLYRRLRPPSPIPRGEMPRREEGG
jgi:hypothetical protein